MTSLGGIIGSVVTVILSVTFATVIVSLQKKVVKKPNGQIDFKKTDIYFKWTRWDTVNLICAIYAFASILCLLIFLSLGESIENPLVQFFIHQGFVFTTLAFAWLISRVAFTLKGIKERWNHEFESK
ncbi:MAG TPA: hypothetical protein VNM69_19520 [Bacillus sp. (in: firmicutes)]|uniref:hypothetical protein n=1 Tax=Bacillus litorisediminis TaxID=2922713 RepID=UPI001FAB7601|nr:hypothetical protein [Bacillus litorisediminis]HWO78061.1 hypothetical protein [Bacillus sp. (in: firmicutes)]